MSVAFRSAANAHNFYTSATLTINKPTGTVNGDLLIAIIGGTPSTLSGWTSIGSAASGTSLATVHAYWKLASSEPSTYSWSLSSSSCDCWGVIAAYSGCDGTTPVDTTHTTTAAHTGTAFTTSAVTTTAQQTLVGWAMEYKFDGSSSASTTWTVTGATSRSTQSDVEGGSPNNEQISYVICDKVPGAGSNSQTLTASQSSDGGASGIILLNPAGTSASAGSAAATAAANGATCTLVPGAGAGNATATAAGLGPSVGIGPVIGVAAATAAANIIGLARLATSASATASANNITSNIAPTIGVAAATAAGQGIQAGIGAIPGAASATAAGQSPRAGVGAVPGTAQATASAFEPSVRIGWLAHAGLATVAVAGMNTFYVGIGIFPAAITLTATAYNAIILTPGTNEPARTYHVPFENRRFIADPGDIRTILVPPNA